MNNQFNVDIKLPVDVMEKALKLRNSIRAIYIALYTIGRPCTSEEVAQSVGHARAYVNMRLQGLVDMGYATVESKGKTKYFEATK